MSIYNRFIKSSSSSRNNIEYTQVDMDVAQSPNTNHTNTSLTPPIDTCTSLNIKGTKTITFKSVLIGSLVGILLCFTNMFFGLQSGWISMMSLQGSLLGYGICQYVIPTILALPSKLKNNKSTNGINKKKYTFGISENVFIQTLSTAIATLPLAAGFVGVIPAIEILFLKETIPFFKLVMFSIGVSFFEKEKLRFPSGKATAQMISLLHDSHDEQSLLDTKLRNRMKTQWIMLVFSFLLSSLFSLLNYIFRGYLRLPFASISSDLYLVYSWYMEPTLSYVGQGIIMGPHTTLSMLLGAVIGWGILAPLAKNKGWTKGDANNWTEGPKAWVLWIALAIMIAESIVSLSAVFIKEIKTHSRSLKSYLTNKNNSNSNNESKVSGVSLKTAILGIVFSSILCVLCVSYYSFPQLKVETCFLALLFSYILSILAVRALGETDLNPVSGIGKVTQILFLYIMPGNIVGNLVAGGISEAGAQQAGDLMQDFKTGSMLNTNPKSQLVGQIVGTVISVVVSCAAYRMFTMNYEIPSKTFPIPTAYIWLNTAKLNSKLNDGDSVLPLNVSKFCIAFGVLFALLAVLKLLLTIKKRNKVSKTISLIVPSGIAFAVGIYNTPNFTLPRVVGALLSYAYLNSIFTRIKKWMFVRIFKKNNNLSSLNNTDNNIDSSANVNSNNVILMDSKDTEHYKVLAIVIASGLVLGEGTMEIILLFIKALFLK